MTASTPSSPRPLPLKRLLVVLVTVVGVLVVAEIGLRLLDLPKTASGLDFVSAPWRDPRAFPRDPLTFWKLGREHDWGAPLNRFGLCGPEPDPEKSENGFRVAVIGGSGAMGARTDFDDSVAAQLERSLQGELPGARVEVLVAAVPGFSTFQSRRLWQQVGPEFAPDLVLLYCGLDDCMPAVRAADAELARAAGHPPRWRLLRLLRLWSAEPVASAAQVEKLLASSDAPHGRRVPVADFEANVDALIAASRAGGAEVCVVAPAVGRSLEQHLGAFADYRSTLKRVAQRHQVYCVDAGDLVAAFETSLDRPPCPDLGESHGFRDGMHLSAEAQTVLAQMLLTRARTHPRYLALASRPAPAAPVVTGVTPAAVTALQAAEVSITGRGFAAARSLRVWLGGQWVTSLRTVDDAHLTARVPLELVPGRHDVRMTSADGIAVVEAGVGLEVGPVPLAVALAQSSDRVQITLKGNAPPGSRVQVFVAPSGRSTALPTRAGPFWLQVGVPGEKPARAPFCFASLPFPRFEAIAAADGNWQASGSWQPDPATVNAVLQGVIWLPGDRAQALLTEVAVRMVPR